MTASKENPAYTAYVVVGNTKYDISSATASIDISDGEKQVAKQVTIDLMNVKSGDQWLSTLIKPRSRLFLYANDGEKNEEVFRGFVWSIGSRWGTEDRDLRMRCYDNLIYFQESEESAYFSAGKSTKDVLESICSKWGVTLEYSYESITHSKLALRGTLTDIIMEDLLEPVRERTGTKYVLVSEKDVIKVRSYGQNTTVYKIEGSQNAISGSVTQDMDGMVTQVVILGKADDDDRVPVEATVSGDTGTYGTLQKLMSRDENTTLAAAKEEAQTIINEKGKPGEVYEIEAPDIPWIRKGDKVSLNVGTISGKFIAIAIDRTIENQQKKMTMTLEKA